MEAGNWEILIQEIKNGRCVLILGPETSILRVNGTNKFSREILIEMFTSGLEDTDEKFEIEDFFTTSLIYQNAKHISKGKLINEVSNFYKTSDNEPNELIEKLALLPFPLIINSTPDNRIVRYLKEQNKDVLESFYNYRGNKENLEWEYLYDSYLKPFVFSLYGSIKDPRSLVITEDDLLEFLIAIIEKNPPLPASITSVIQDENISFLFLGFGFKSWYLRILLYVLLGKKERMYDSVALEDFSFFPSHKRKLTNTFYKKLYNITFDEDLKLSDFVSELIKKYNELKDSDKKVSPSPANINTISNPKVFICHASEDKEYALKLYENLELKGIRPWLDKKSLLAGDQWDKQIKNEIKNIDYFLVLNSKSLTNKFIGYVNMEINLALETQLRYRGGIRFIIPIIIDDSPLIDEFQALHFLKLERPEHTDELVSIIEFDQKIRRNGREYRK